MGDIDWQYLLFSFDGRINRGKFWLGAVAIYAFPDPMVVGSRD